MRTAGPGCWDAATLKGWEDVGLCARAPMKHRVDIDQGLPPFGAPSLLVDSIQCCSADHATAYCCACFMIGENLFKDEVQNSPFA